MEGKIITLFRLAQTKLSWGSSNFVFDHEWIQVTLGRVAMPFVSPLTRVTQAIASTPGCNLLCLSMFKTHFANVSQIQDGKVHNPIDQNVAFKAKSTNEKRQNSVC